MDKQYRSALILLATFAIFLGSYMAYQVYYVKQNEGNDVEQKKKINILSLKKEDVQQIQITQSNGDLLLTYNNGKFELRENPKLELDEATLNDLMTSLSLLQSDKLIGENITNLSDFGLAVPSGKLLLKLGDGSQKTLEIGDALPQEKGYYVKIAGEAKVYLLDKETSEKLMLNLTKIRSKQLVSFKKENTGLLRLSRQDNTVFEALSDKQNPAKWNLTKPFAYQADDAKIDEILSLFFNLKIKDFIPKGGKDLEAYGLEAPVATLALAPVDGQPTELIIGKEKEGEGRYVMKAGGDEILLLETAEVAFTGYAWIDVANRSVIQLNQADISGLEISVGSDKTTVSVEAGKDLTKVETAIQVNGIKLKDNKPLYDFLNPLTEMTASQIQPQDTVSGAAVLTISISLKGSTEKIEFFKKGESNYAVMQNGIYQGKVIAQTDLDKLLEKQKQLKDAVK